VCATPRLGQGFATTPLRNPFKLDAYTLPVRHVCVPYPRDFASGVRPVFVAGRWHVGLGRSFIKFPTTYQTIKFSFGALSVLARLSPVGLRCLTFLQSLVFHCVVCRKGSGRRCAQREFAYYSGTSRRFLAFSRWFCCCVLMALCVAQLECSLQYQLNVSMLISTYRNFSTSYHSRYRYRMICSVALKSTCLFVLPSKRERSFVKVAKDIIQSNTDATHFTTPQFYTHRRLIADSLFIALKNEMAAYGAIVRDFQASFCSACWRDVGFKAV
jgi:hypothetical protein